MKRFLDSLKSILFFSIYSIVLALIMSILYFFTPILSKTINAIIFITTIIFFAIISFKAGKNINEKGYKKGLKIGFILTSFMFIISLLFKDFFSIQKFIYYGVLILTAMTSSIIGINFKKRS